jgi:hypothetical protein
MKILICGSRHWTNYQTILNIMKRLIVKYGDITIIEGGAPGADTPARKAAIECGVPYTEFPLIEVEKGPHAHKWNTLRIIFSVHKICK